MYDLEESFRELSKTENVFLSVPNLIGYGRILLALLSYWFMPTNYVAAALCYIISGLPDAVDVPRFYLILLLLPSYETFHISFTKFLKQDRCDGRDARVAC